jgi:dihydropteroate synthase
MATESHPTFCMAHGRALPLDRVRLMGIVNVTPDSFSDGGLHGSPAAALAHALALIEQGADMLDIGGESTRPGSARVDAHTQRGRVLPAIEAIRRAGITVPISVDTTLAEVAQDAIAAGADAINDVAAGQESPAMFELARQTGAGLILMHRLLPPNADAYSHQYARDPDYTALAGPDAEPARWAGVDPVVPAVRRFLAERAAAAVAAGVRPEAIVLDPGLGFGKSVAQNFELMRQMGVPGSLGLAGIARPGGGAYPLLGAVSRKSFLGRVAGIDEPAARVQPSVAAGVAMALAGVRLIRVHDVRAHREALAVVEAMRGADSAPRR